MLFSVSTARIQYQSGHNEAYDVPTSDYPLFLHDDVIFFSEWGGVEEKVTIGIVAGSCS